jgi:flagellar biosynthesis/type III secretory pathway M-ring protein FliF/YscJ
LLRGLAPVQRVLLAGGVIIIGAILWVFVVLITRHDAQPSGSAGRLTRSHTLFVFVYIAVLRPIRREMVAALRASAERMNLQKVGGKTASTASGAEDIELQTNPAQVAGTLKRHLADQVRSEPSIASHVVRGWIREEV